MNAAIIYINCRKHTYTSSDSTGTSVTSMKVMNQALALLCAEFPRNSLFMRNLH